MADDNEDQILFWTMAFECANLGAWDWNLSTNECRYSPTWFRMLGYIEEDLSGIPDLWLELAHPEDKKRAREIGDRHIAGLVDSVETEFRLRHKAGHWIWVLDRGRIVDRDASGTPLRMIGVQTDITKQKQAEAQLEEVNRRFQLALDASNTGIWHHNIDSSTSYWSIHAREIFEYFSETNEVSADLWHTFLHPDDRERAEKEHLTAGSSENPAKVRYRIIRRSGEVRHIESLVRFVPGFGPAGQILGTVRDITEDANRISQLEYAADHDALTGLVNRAAFDRVLENTSIHSLPLALLCIDLDHFKAVNDIAGHAAGDQALRDIATAIRKCLADGALAARLGGDEFAILVPNCEVAEAEQLAVKVLAATRTVASKCSTSSPQLGASIGIAVVRDEKISVIDALSNADDACYEAKAAGRNQFRVFAREPISGIGGFSLARLVSETQDALYDGRLKLFGQKIFPLDRAWESNPHIEVLARLVSHDGQIFAAGHFMPALERFGVASQLDRWIIKKALSNYAPALLAGDVTLGFNLSALTLGDPTLWDFVDQLVEESGVSRSRIRFEITETATLPDVDSAANFVRKARKRGYHMSLDDFGVGTSSFDYLRRFPVDQIKIDGSFIERLVQSRFDREIVSGIVNIARKIGCSVVAEKIERQKVFALVKDMGVEFGQGYWLHKPEPLELIIGDLAHRGLENGRTIRI